MAGSELSSASLKNRGLDAPLSRFSYAGLTSKRG